MVAGIGNNGGKGSLLSGINRAQKDSNRSMERLASGKRLNRASDDPAAIAVLAALEAESSTLSQAGRNSGDIQSMLQIADGALGEIGNITTRMEELAVQAANGTLSDTQRASLANEFNALKSEISRMTSTTQFNGINPISGGESVTAQVGTDADANSQIEVKNPDLASLTSELESADISTREGAGLAITAVKKFASSVNSARGELGAVSSRMNTAREGIESAILATEQAAAAIRDVDIAEESARRVSANIRQQASVALSAQANLNSRTVLNLLA